MGGVQSMTLLPKSVVLDGAMRHKMRAQGTPTLIIANQHTQPVMERGCV